MDSEFAEKQRVMAERDLPAWNRANATTGSNAAPSSTLQGPGGDSSNQARAAILQSLQLLLQQAQTTQGTISNPARRTKKPSKHWEGTIDVLG
jgi:hypothetical protein